MERRLAAILAADVVSYTRLMGADEPGTHNALKQILSNLIDPKSHQYGGRVIKVMGDGVLMEFASVVDAVAFAVEVQCTLKESNENLPKDKRIEYRIGINIGDIIVDGDDLYGEGVNIAARLESVSDPGGICITRNVKNETIGKLELDFKDLGPVKLKNVQRPIRLFSVMMNEKAEALCTPLPRSKTPQTNQKQKLIYPLILAAMLGGLSLFAWQNWFSKPGPANVAGALQTDETKPSIAILPFSNMGQKQAQDYFADGLAEDLTTDLSRINELKVIASNSSKNLQDKDADYRQIGKTLGAQYLIKGSVRRSDDQVRINVQLIDAYAGAAIWAERFDRKISDVFAFQDEVLERTVAALSLRLSPKELVTNQNRGTTNVNAYDLYLRARALEGQSTQAGTQEALEVYEQIIKIDPRFAVIYARMANLYEQSARAGWISDGRGAMDMAIRLAQKSLELDQSNPFAHWTLGRVTKGDTLAHIETAIRSIEKAIELQPNYADAFAYLTYLYTGSGRLTDASAAIKKAMELNPIYPYWYLHARGVVDYMTDNFDGAIVNFEAAIARNPAVHFIQFWLAAAYAMSDRMDDANWQVEEMLGMGIKSTVTTILSTSHMQHPTMKQKFEKGLRLAGIPD